MIKRILQTIARSILVASVLCGLLPLPAFTPVVQASKGEPVVQVQPSQSGKYASDHVIVKLRAPALATSQSMSQGITGNNKLDLTLAQAGGRGLKPLFVASKSVRKDPSGLGRIYRVDLKAGQNVEDTLALLQADPNVEYAEPDYVAQKITTPNDPQYPTQWGLAKIQAEGAWAQTNGSPSVIIAMVDSGIDLTHEDLVDNLWVNPGEIPGNGIDDDNNGFIDDFQGWNFVAGSNDPWDDNGHGTLVAGIAAAKTNNGKGIAGVCGDCRIMPVKVMQPSGSANYSDIAAGINYAVVKGAKVINLSLGGYANSKALQDAVNTALAQNIVVVAGAGNDNVSTPFYPAAYDGVISVAASDSADHKANFSNYGSWVKVSAPGVDVLTTALGGDYLLSSGTSQAGPFVSGLAGLLVTMHPDWTPAMVLGQLTHTVDGIDSLNPGFEGKLGAGRINATKALQPSYPILSYVGYSANGTAGGRPDFNADATLTVSLSNDWADAPGVSATLSTTDPLVSVTMGTANFGDILSGKTKSNSIPYAIHVATAAGYNHSIPFTLAVTANATAYNKTLNFTVTTRSSVEEWFGTIADDTVWTSDKTYKLTGNVGVAPGVTLTIQPGTVVQIAGNFALNIAGTLIANGTPSQPIQFEPFTAGQTWSDILIDDPAQDGVSGTNGEYLSGTSLDHVVIQGATSGLQCNHATPRFSYLTITSGGINCTLGQMQFSLPNSSIQGNVNISGYAPWAGRSSMNVSQYGLAAASDNNQIYAAGGVLETTPASYLNTLEIYNLGTDTWTSGANMPTPRYWAGAVESGGKVFVIGGLSNDIFVSTVEAYDTSSNQWETRTNMPTVRAGLGVAVVNGKIYAVGGQNNSALATVELYDPASDTWTSLASMPTPRYSFGLAGVNGKLYAIGGYDDTLGGQTANVDEYDPATDSWTGRASLPAAQGSISAAASGGKVYVFGGSSLAEVYDPLTDNWTTFPLPSSYRIGEVNPVAIGTNLFIMGGYDSARIPNRTVEMLNIQSFQLPYDYQVAKTSITGALTLIDNSIVTGSNVTGEVSVGARSQVTLSTTGVIVAGAQSQVTFSTTSGISSGDSSTVEDNLVIGNVTMVTGTAQRNQISGGNLTGGNGILFNQNVVSSGGISAGNSSTVTGNSMENSPGVGLQAGSGSTVTGNRIIGAASHGITASTGTITGNLVANITGDGLRAGAATIQNNTFTGIKGNGVYLNGIPIKLEYNNFEFNTGTYDLYNDNPAGQYTLAQRNWWGTTTTATIQKRILEFNTDMYKGRVTFLPILTGPSQTAPAYVRSLTLNPPSPVGIQTVNFTVGFSRPMDVTKNPLVSFESNSADTWTTKASMPTARIFLGVAGASNGKIYAVGGNGGLSTVEEYNPITDTWTTKDSMPTARQGLSVAAASNGKIYAIGGDGGANVVEEYDPATNTWTKKANMPTGRSGLGLAATANGKIYAIGGDGGANVVEAYDLATNTWATKASMPTPRYYLGVASDNNGKIYAVGGIGLAGSPLSTVEEYDPSINTWTTKASMSIDRYSLGVGVAQNGKIYAIGGTTPNGTRAIATVEEYDPNTNTWTTKASMPTQRSWLGVAATDNGKIYAIGGWLGFGNFYDTVEEYTPHGWGGEQITANPQWLDTTHYQASYDFTSLTPRGTYFVTTQDAWGLDGLAIPPYQGANFVVDYAGYISVTTPPDTPVVSAWGNGSLTTLAASWTPTDLHSAITGYRYAIGSTAGGVDVVNWTNVVSTNLTRSGLNLTRGQTYYVSIKARNEGGLWSLAGASNGVIAGMVTAPTLASISPTVTVAGSGDFTLTVNGSNFTPASIVRWNGTSLVTTFGTSAQLTAAVGIGLLGVAGTVNVTVFNPGGGETTAQVFTIENPVPSLTDLSPSSAVAGGTGLILTVTGTNFVSNTVIRWGSTDLATTFVSSTQLTASIGITKFATAGTVNVTAFSPAPGGGTTSALPFTIDNPTPSATTLSPDHVTVGATGFTLTVNGSNFVSNSIIRWGSTDLTTTYVSSARLTASIDTGKVAEAGPVNVTVFTPTPGGGASPALTFTINEASTNNPLPTASSLLPDHATAGASAFILTVTGTDFISSSVIRWNGADLATIFVSSSQLTTNINSSKVAAAGTANVTVFNPAPGGGTASALTFAINNPAPTASSLLPDHVIAGASTFTLTVNGSGFVSTSVVRWGATTLTTTYVSSTQLTTSIDASKVTAGGTASVTIFTPTPGGGTASPLSFTINNPVPTAGSLLPDHVTAGSIGFTLTVNGNGFMSTSVIHWGATALATTYVSSTQITASVDASKLATAGNVNVTVFNLTPGGGTSSALLFTVNNVSTNNPVPTASSLSPDHVTAGAGSFTLTVNGADFVTTSVIHWGAAALITIYVDSTKLTASIDASKVSTAGTVNVTVFNPTPGGGTSSALIFTTNGINPLPVLTGMDHQKVKVKSPSFTLTVSGTGFVNGSVVRWNGVDLATTFVNGTQLTAIVDASRLTSIGMVNITVYTPGPGGGASSSLELEIEAIKQFMPMVQKTS